MSELRLAFATYAAHPAPTPDDDVLVRELARRGVAVAGIPWDAPVDWSAHDGVVVRSTWDYHLRHADFTRWVRALEADGVTLLNVPPLLLWNADKRYLRDLEAEGIAVVPTAWSDVDDEEPALGAIARRHGWAGPLVVKPAVSASAHDTWTTAPRPSAEDERRYGEARRRSRLLVQPFVPEVERDGEWSLVFLGGGFSHAVLKRPRAGDFRVQAEHGGSAERASPPPSLVDDAGAVLAAAARRLALSVREIVYARVDGVDRGGRLLLMELECVEPSLFFAVCPEGAPRLAEAIVTRVSGPAVTDAHGRASRQGHASARR